ncbi:hypothetical protein AGMMS50229_09150 [Campylobacterota bacterium]|nr:hypothetical protein AGMMS50229_09150 [Campylobacterota bacterium]
MQEAVRYAKLDGETLTIKLSSQTMKAEYYYKRDLLLSLFRDLARKTKLCEGYNLTKIRLLVDYDNGAKSDDEPKRYELRFTERAGGGFENSATNPAIYEAIEKLRSAIIKNRTT